MQHPKITLSLVTLFAILSVSLAISLSSFIGDRIESFERTQESRSRVQAQIHDALERRYDARILETRLLGRCGITAYIVTLRDVAGSESTLYFDIDTGSQISHDLSNGCPHRRSGPAAARGAGAAIRYTGFAVPEDGLIVPLPQFRMFRSRWRGYEFAFIGNSYRPASLVPM